MRTPILFALAVTVCLPPAAFGAAAPPVVAQQRQVKDIGPEAQPLKDKLAVEVNKILQAGRLAPFRTLYGEGHVRYAWREPWQMVYTLSLALPHLPADAQTKVKAYLKEEIAARPPWSLDLLGTSGARQADGLSQAVFDEGCTPGQVSTAFFPYALWVYGSNTGDWGTLQTNWATIKDNFKKHMGDKLTLEHYSGTIGMARLARSLGDIKATAKYDAMAQQLVGYFQDFAAVQANASKIYTGNEKPQRGTEGVLYAFFNLTPEAARLVADNPKLKAGAAAYAKGGWTTWPLWWMAQCPVGDGGYYDEGCCGGPEQQGMLLQYEAWIAGTPAAKLAYYVDVPDALVGDCTFIRNLVTAIEAFGQQSWATP